MAQFRNIPSFLIKEIQRITQKKYFNPQDIFGSHEKNLTNDQIFRAYEGTDPRDPRDLASLRNKLRNKAD